MTTSKTSHDYPRRLDLLLPSVAAVALLLYGMACTFGFVIWDDPKNVRDNEHLLPPTLAGLGWIWTHVYERLYIPATYTVWWCLAWIAGSEHATTKAPALDPFVFHLANVLSHAGATALVYLILKSLLDHRWAAAAGALLFAVHPLQVEAVTWVTGMKDTLSGSLGLLSIWLYLLSTPDADNAPTRRPKTFYAIALAAFILAVLAKPTTITVPVSLFVIDTLLRRRGWRQSVRSLLPFMIVAGIGAATAMIAQPISEAADGGRWWLRPLIATDALAFYLIKLVVPYPLCVEYDRAAVTLIARKVIYYSWILPTAVALIAWFFRRQSARPAAAGLLFVAALLPVLGVVPFYLQLSTTTADRYLYQAMLGPSLAFACLIASAERSARWRLPMLTIAGVVLLALAILTVFQEQNWRDSETLLRHTISVNPHSASSYADLGLILQRQNHDHDALAAFLDAETYAPRSGRIQVMIGRSYERLGKLDEAERRYRLALTSEAAKASATEGVLRVQRLRQFKFPGPTSRSVDAQAPPPPGFSTP